MGCGGSRADAIEPRYYESWTRETESTWLTNTDSESPPEPGGADPGSRELGAGRTGILEDGKSTQTGGTSTPATTGILSTEKRTISGAQCVNTAGAGPPRQSSFRAAESKRDTQKMSTKEVTINVSKNNRPSDRRMTKNCVN
ncbi:brain and acute leukemia cytoplasmic protein [Centrocercus urophasianus]|uniref:brain and acute leukemia cytoplasmic protein n=1 Tax=Centrocercus urophasianus TaxID=9002 RepID=UPI001C64CDE8|nr:brain and acute leukemia cytoplasmic protein [Centrocercus urophasianus]